MLALKKAMAWLEWVSHKKDIAIQHAGNGGEHVIMCNNHTYKADGFYIKNGQKTVLEFLGCFYHGHPSCYHPDTKNALQSLSMKELFMATQSRLRHIANAGYKVEVIWECEYEKLLKEDIEMQTFVKRLNINAPLKPRDAFFGGRTNAVKLKAEATADTQIKYYDVTSLYPWVNKYCEYPFGHPEMVCLKTILQADAIVIELNGSMFVISMNNFLNSYTLLRRILTSSLQ